MSLSVCGGRHGSQLLIKFLSFSLTMRKLIPGYCYIPVMLPEFAQQSLSKFQTDVFVLSLEEAHEILVSAFLFLTGSENYCQIISISKLAETHLLGATLRVHSKKKK